MDYRELELAGVAVDELLARLMNNTKLVKMIIGKFADDKTHASLCAAVAAGDWQAAEFACHTLKGMCGNLSLNTLFAMTQEQLRLFRAGESGAAAAMMPQITEKYDAAIAHFQLWLSRQ